MTVTERQILEGMLGVHGRRLEALKGAIERQNLADIEFVYDQVWRSYTKLLEGVNRGASDERPDAAGGSN